MTVHLKLALLKQAIPQYEVARRLGITETRLSRLVCGRLTATQAEKAALAALLNTTPEELFGVDSPQTSAVAQSKGGKP